MKRWIYSRMLKTVAVLLLIFYVAVAVWTVTDAVIQYENESDEIYQFEKSFEDSRYMQSLLFTPDWEVYRAYREYYSDGEIQTKSIEAFLEESLRELWCADRVYYRITVNGTVFTNCEGQTEKSLSGMEFYTKSTVDERGVLSVETTASEYDGMLEFLPSEAQGTRITVISAVTPAFTEGVRIAWDRQESLFFETLYQVGALALLSLGLFVYLIAVAGKSRDGETVSPWMDLVWVEVHLAVLAGAIVGGIVLWITFVVDGYFISPRLLEILSVSIGVAVSALTLISSLSLVRKIKHGSFLRTCLLAIFLKWLWRMIRRGIALLRRLLKELKRALACTLFRKTGVIFCILLLIYTAIIGYFGVMAARNAVGILLGILLFLCACLFLAYRAMDLDQVKKGAQQIRKGDFGYKIGQVKCESMKELAGDINGIAEGLEQSVAERVKAERMKTELITNVSHDLKNPLTSIISYTELLAEMEGLPEEARDYVAVISKKSDRLKKLTRDLFDISKAQSGNEAVVWETLDGALLINQALGEYDNEIKESGLTFCVTLEKELFFRADGEKLSRVIGNLLDNILKYTMEHTRVFIQARKIDGEICMEFKNVASYPITFDSQEIVGRFTRGDESRSTEGNGLGLAIVKSYTELCGGRFEVVVDGDLFKAVLTFREASDLLS